MRGFTLFELLMVLLILGVVSAVAAPRLSSAMGANRARTAAEDLVSALRATRSEAIRRNRDLALVIDVDARTFRQPNRPPREMGRDIILRVVAASQERTGASTTGIRFYPSGSGSGGEISLEDAKTRQVVSVDWLSGRVAIRGGPHAP